MRQAIKYFQAVILPVVVSTLLLSCASVDDQADQAILFNQVDQIRKRIDRLLEEEKPAEALQWIYYYHDHEESDQLALEEWEQTALTTLTVQLDEAVQEREYSRAISIYSSLDSLGKAELAGGEYSLPALKNEYLHYLAEINRTGAAAGMMSSGFVSPGDLSEEDLVFLESRFTTGENRKALSMVALEMDERGLSLRPETEELLSRKVTMESLLEGTVTIWVDKGLRLERGVGLPDRVIGSGFFIDKSGYLLTNYHVIESEVNPEYKGYSKLYVKLSDDRNEKIPAKVIGWDRHFDLALLKVEIDAPYVFSFASDNDFSLGEKIFAIGSPGGLNNSITSGTVSATKRPLMTMGEAIQIDVPINPGNSGGPLLNQKGEVKGVVFAGIAEFEGINFAINGEYVKKFLPALFEGGPLAHAWLGVGGFQEFDSLETLYVLPGSPADRLGIQREDRILSVNGISVKRNQDVRDILLEMDPGEIVLLEWERGDESLRSVVTLGGRPDIPLEAAVNQDTRENLIPPLFGLVLTKVSGQQYRVERVYTGSGADEASISAGDVIFLKKWMVNEKEGYVLMQFIFKGVKAGYLESAIQLGAGLESAAFF